MNWCKGWNSSSIWEYLWTNLMTTGRRFSRKSGRFRRFGYGWERYCDKRGKIPMCWKFLEVGGARGSVIWI